jgi:hypothetical protein
MPQLPDGIELPDAVSLWEGESRTEAFGDLLALDRDTAKLQIDLEWWRDSQGLPSNARRGEHDRGWEWHKLIGTLRSEASNTGHAWAVRAGGQLQGAILYQLPGLSELEPGMPTLFIYRLATTPWNRSWLKHPRSFGGVGRGLLRLAVYHSYRYAIGGRVTLEAEDDQELVEWYTSFGFRLVTRGADGITILELTPEAAAVHLSGL